MGVIYKSAYLTIIAASGEDVEAGLSRYEDPKPDITGPACSFRCHREPLLIENPAYDPIARVEWSKYGSRGWTFQERKLANRSVVFTEHEVFFECSHSTLRERYVSDSGDLHARRYWSSFDRDEVSYHTDVENYTKRNLTFPEDRLDAFSGVLHALYLPVSGLGVAQAGVLGGLPFDCFQQALCWLPLPSSSRRFPTRIPTDKLRRRRLPSWSWVGWSGAIRYYLDLDGACPMPQILDEQNILLQLSKAHFLQEANLATEEEPIYTGLHLWTQCLRVRAKHLQHSSSQEDVELELPDHPSAHAIESDLYLTADNAISPGQPFWIAHLYTVPSSTDFAEGARARMAACPAKASG